MDEEKRLEMIESIAKIWPLTERGADLSSMPSLCREALQLFIDKGSYDRPPFSTLSEDASNQRPFSLQDNQWNRYCLAWLLEEFYPGREIVPQRGELRTAVVFYLDVLNAVFLRERAELKEDPTRDLATLSEDEAHQYGTYHEYHILLECLNEQHLYAFMRLHRIVMPYNALGHIAGVHFVSLYIARQLLNTDVKIDLALSSGAAILHDIGKFGCRAEEASRVPYLHYYYTYEFAQRFFLPTIGQIASSHSVWDLELENLSVESLVLIYSDFRVKSEKNADGTENVRFLTLKESYEVILSKLDSLDNAKRKRYAKVYAKLQDFEDYMVSLGVSTDLMSPFCRKRKKTPYSVMDTQSMVRSFKYLAISRNLRVMYTTGHDTSFISLLEEIRGEKDWRHVRAFLTVIDEYSGYFTQVQKDVILSFLYEMLSHQDGDIRRQAARIAASVISGIEITFKKELPEDAKAPAIGEKMVDVWRGFLRRMLFPDRMVTEQHRRWIGYAMKTVVRDLLQNTSGDKRREIINVIMEHYKSARWEGLTCFLLLDCLTEVPYDLCSENQKKLLFRFNRKFLSSDDTEIRVAALRFLVCWLHQGCIQDEEMLTTVQSLSALPSDPICVRYLVKRIRQILPVQEEPFQYETSLLYLENQRSEIPWIYKLVNLEILRRHMENETDSLKIYQYASHLLNMLQFTPRVTNKLQAGENLVRIVNRLSETQRYEIMLELVRSLSMGQYAVSKYIPYFCARIYVLLSYEERRALLSQFHTMCGDSNPAIVILTLETLSVILQYLPAQASGSGLTGDSSGTRAQASDSGLTGDSSGTRAQASDSGLTGDSSGRQSPDSAVSARAGFLSEERHQLEGMLCCGTVHYNPEIAREAFYFLGEGIFGSSILTPLQKKDYFTAMSRKILTFIRWEEPDPLWYYNAASLNHIYRFISDYLQDYGPITFRRSTKIAFFPGTFDPFSLGHKAIVREIASMGFHVFLAVDEFSWSKNTQPYMIRRKIMVMSVADLNDVFLFPIEYPVNIACPNDLRKLSSLFPGREVFIVAGSDVIKHASAYNATPSEGSIHFFPHILFQRNTEDSANDNNSYLARLKGEIINLKLPAYFESMSSSRIRTNVSAGRGIDDLVEKVVQNYIHDKGLYTMEPIYKRAARTRACDVLFSKNGVNYDARLMDRRHDDKVCGSVSCHDLQDMELYERCGHDLDLTTRLRSRALGRIVAITSLSGDYDELHDDRYNVLNEMLASIQENGASYAICFESSISASVLMAHGFRAVNEIDGCYIVDLRRPLVFFFDTPSFIKEEFANEYDVKRVLWQSHRKLREQIASLFPGNLVLCFDSGILNHRMIRLITSVNPMPEKQIQKRVLGEKICVPFGKILKGVLVPQCVTKDLNTEKFYDIDMDRFTIREFPDYTSLRVQIRTIRSFMRPVILVDDIYHKGFRLAAVRKVMSEEGLPLDRLIVGVLSGRGQSLAKLMGVPVEPVYRVPNMRAWLIESDLYPFIGGDGIAIAEQIPSSPSLPSVNSILPYHLPSYFKGASIKAFYHMSQVCIENSKQIFLVLEKIYQKKYGRKLTMDRIGEVLGEPRHPDTCILDADVVQESPSLLLDRELKKLGRLKHLLDGEFKL